MKKSLWISLLAIVILSSCVSRKSLTYLQDWGSELELDSNGYQVIHESYYQIQKNDLLSIQIKTFNEEIDKYFNLQESNQMRAGGAQQGNAQLYFNGYSVDPEGFIQLPVLSKIDVQGLTLQELTTKLEQLLSEYFNEKAMYVKVQLAGIRYTVVGEVRSPGQYFLYQNTANVFEAIALAGDIDFLGNRYEVMIMRQYPDGIKYFELDLTDQKVINDPRFLIQPNDVINVKPLKQKSWGIGQTGFQTLISVMSLASSSIALILAYESLTN